MRSSLILLLLLTACATTRDRNRYLRALDAHTEELRVYRGFATALILRGTYLSPGFRDALAEERARLLGPAADDHAGFVSRLQEDGEAYWEIVFSAESPIAFDLPRFGDDDAGWRLRLLADGVEQPLVTVFRVENPTPLQIALYAHKNAWNELYVARFGRTVGVVARLELHVGSGFGHGTLVWTGDELR